METTDFGPFIRDIKEKVEKTILQFCMEKSIDLNQNKSIHQTLMSLLESVSEEQYQKLYYSSGKTKEAPLEYLMNELYPSLGRSRRAKISYRNSNNWRYTVRRILVYSSNHIVLIYNQKSRYEKKFD